MQCQENNEILLKENQFKQIFKHILSLVMFTKICKDCLNLITLPFCTNMWTNASFQELKRLFIFAGTWNFLNSNYMSKFSELKLYYIEVIFQKKSLKNSKGLPDSQQFHRSSFIRSKSSHLTNHFTNNLTSFRYTPSTPVLSYFSLIFRHLQNERKTQKSEDNK